MHSTIAISSVLRIAMVLGGLTALAACSNDAPQSKAPPAQELSETFKEFGDYEVHFNALRTDGLTPDIARNYGIQRSENRVMLTVTLLHQEGDGAPRKPMNADVKVDAYNLTGQLKDLEMRRISEGEAIYYIGETTISGAEILVFDIKVTPEGMSAPLEVKLKREFVAG